MLGVEGDSRGLDGLTEFDRGVRAAWDSVNALIRKGDLPATAHSERYGIVLALNAIANKFPESI